MAVHIALHEIGGPFESRFISLAGTANRAPDYLALNLEGKVPTLLIDGRPLTEVAAILYYLARRFPEAGLWPAGDIETDAQGTRTGQRRGICRRIQPGRHEPQQHLQHGLGRPVSILPKSG